MKFFSFQGVVDKTEGSFAERKPLLQEQSPCLLQSRLKCIWFSELAHGVLLGERPFGEVMVVALCQRQM